MLCFKEYSILDGSRAEYLVHRHVDVVHSAPRLHRGQDLVVYFDPGVHLLAAWYRSLELQA